MTASGSRRRCAGLALATSILVAVQLGAAADEGKDAAAAQPKREDLERNASEQFSGVDRSGDGVLRAAEIPQGWLERFDRNGDGAITRTEFVEVSSRPEKLRRLHPMRDARARAATLRAFDRDKNGVVEREEYPGRDDAFRSADRNRSDTLEPAELLAMAADEIEEIRRRIRSPSRNEFLSLFDLDGNNQVTPEEYDGPAAAFRKHDTDGNGVVTYEELYPERMMQRAAPQEAPKPENLSAIQALDKDGDGKVARAEFAGNDAAWRRLDRNGDGWITAADAR